MTGSSVQGGKFSVAKYPLLEDLISKLQFSDDVYPFSFSMITSEGGISSKTRFLNLSDQRSFEGLSLSYNDELIFLIENRLINLMN